MRSLVHDVVLSRHNPLLEFCNAGVIREMLTRVQSNKSLGVRPRTFLWTFVFASAWLKQVTEDV